MLQRIVRFGGQRTVHAAKLLLEMSDDSPLLAQNVLFLNRLHRSPRVGNRFEPATDCTERIPFRNGFVFRDARFLAASVRFVIAPDSPPNRRRARRIAIAPPPIPRVTFASLSRSTKKSRRFLLRFAKNPRFGLDASPQSPIPPFIHLSFTQVYMQICECGNRGNQHGVSRIVARFPSMLQQSAFLQQHRVLLRIPFATLTVFPSKFCRSSVCTVLFRLFT